MLHRKGSRKVDVSLSYGGITLRILTIVSVVIAAHLAVIIVRRVGKKLTRSDLHASISKVRTIVSLSTSTAVFVIYFGSIGLILKEFGISLRAYLASASVMGLAIGFGSQGLVQDVVTGLTLIFSNLISLGDMVEISGQTGIVRQIGMRFTVIENYFGAEVFIPNRTISNVLNYPKGYIRCFVDITLSEDGRIRDQLVQKVNSLVSSAFEQFSGMFLTPPSIEAPLKTSSDKEFLRVIFRIWPGRGTAIETSLKQEIVQSLKTIDPSYAEWMVSVNYEVEKKQLAL